MCGELLNCASVVCDELKTELDVFCVCVLAGMPTDSGRGHIMLPVAGDGRGRGYTILLAGAGL